MLSVECAFGSAREEFGQAGGFLVGDFSAADAMFAPVINRLHVYDVAVSVPTRSYPWQDWAAQAQAEPWVIDNYEIGWT